MGSLEGPGVGVVGVGSPIMRGVVVTVGPRALESWDIPIISGAALWRGSLLGDLLQPGFWAFICQSSQLKFTNG